MQGGFYENENSRNDTGSNNKFRERGGLIPITAKILHDSVVNQEEAVEFSGTLLSDVSIVGYLKNFTETDTKVIVKIWDQTGVVDTIFYNKNENETHSGLSNFTYVENNKLVKIFGTVKTYKKEKSLQGAKIMYVNDNELLYHQLEVVNDWLYLTGKINTLKQESSENYNNDARNLARSHNNSNLNNNNSNNYGNNNNYQNNNYNNSNNNNSRNDYNANPNLSPNDNQVLNVLKELARKTGSAQVKRNELYQALERKNLSHQVINNSVRTLNDSGYIFEEDDYYQLQ